MTATSHLSQSEKDYQQLHALSRHSRILEGVSSLLGWDQETYMPPGSAGIRSEQLKTMAGLIHRERTSPAYTKALSQLIDIPTGEIKAKDLSDKQVAALKEWRRDYRHHTSLPSEFVEEFAKVSSQALVAWRTAKKENAFQLFAPYLDRLITLSRQKAEFLGYQDHPYDALLDEYEPDMTTQQIQALFTPIRETLTPLIKTLQSQSRDAQFLSGQWDHAKQIAFSNQILDAMGYDLQKGRLDFSTHPFSSASHPTDSRITSRIHPTSLMSHIFVVLHEGGHALYEMGLSQEDYGSPLGEARSLGIHESQSRWWETRIGMSQPFWKHFFPLLQETFQDQLKDISFDQFYLAMHHVQPSFIRVEADEMTYPLHVILRFEMEKALMEGSLSVRDIPDAWNAKMKDYLGIIPSTYAEGCLQDIHWSMGAFGYFPSYTLGNLYAAHLFEGFVKEHSDWEKKVEKGELKFIQEWLHEKVYQHGKRYTTPQLLQQATGKSFTSAPYLEYLKNKYETLYQI